MATGCVCETEVAVGPDMSREQAEAIVALGVEAAVFAILELSQRLGRAVGQCAAVNSPATPSGMIPVHQKPAVKKRGNKPGRKPGHRGARRRPPLQIDQRKDHRAPCCPDCQGPLSRGTTTATRITEDLPENLQPVVTQHTIHKDWCPHCKKTVQPRVPDALPYTTIGNRVLTLSAWLHYGLGQTLDHIVEVFNYHLRCPFGNDVTGTDKCSPLGKQFSACFSTSSTSKPMSQFRTHRKSKPSSRTTRSSDWLCKLSKHSDVNPLNEMKSALVSPPDHGTE